MLSTQSYAVKFFQLKQNQETHATFVRLKEFIELLFPVLWQIHVGGKEA